MRINGDLQADQIKEVVVHPLASPPTSPNEGQWYYDTGIKGLFVFDGTIWQPLSGSSVNSGVIVGTVLAMPFDPVGDPLLLCDGSAVNRVTFADLFVEISTSYGVGDGATTFNIPDLRGEFTRGWADTSGVDPDKNSRTNRGDGQ